MIIKIGLTPLDCEGSWPSGAPALLIPIIAAVEMCSREYLVVRCRITVDGLGEGAMYFIDELSVYTVRHTSAPEEAVVVN